jgi:hypothetical protein
MHDIAIIDLDLKKPAWLRRHSAMRTAQSAYVASAANLMNAHATSRCAEVKNQESDRGND